MLCKIVVNTHGPLRVEGEFEIVDSEGNAYGLGGRSSLALCRCGGSKNKPFCDGAHNTCGFRHVPEARELGGLGGRA